MFFERNLLLIHQDCFSDIKNTVKTVILLVQYFFQFKIIVFYVFII